MPSLNPSDTISRAEWGIGVIGCGRFARFVLAALAPLPGLRLAALASRDAANREAAQRVWAAGGRPTDPGLYHDAGALLADPSVQVVLVMTPPYLHYALARSVISAGRHLFLEKPGALAPEHLAEAARLADARGVAATVDFVMRYNPLTRLVKRAVDQGILGPLERVDLCNEAHGDLPPEHWLWDAEKSGGLLVEHGVHFFDLVNWLAGPGQAVAATALPHPAGPAYAPDRVLAVAVHRGGAAAGETGGADGAYGRPGGPPGAGPPGGVLATYYHAFTRPRGLARASLRLTFRRGFADLYGWIPERLDLAGVMSPEEAAAFTLHPGAQVLAREGDRLEVRIVLPDRQELYRDAIRAAFTDLLRRAADQAHRPAVTLADAVAALHLARAATDMAERRFSPFSRHRQSPTVIASECSCIGPNLYSHVLPGLQREAGEKLDALLFGETPKKEKRQG